MPILKNENKTTVQPNNKIPEANDLLLILKEKDQQLRSVAHDLRNPLGGISSLAALLIEENGLSEEQSELIDAIKSAASYSLKLVEGLLSTKNLDSKLGYHPEIDINAVILEYLSFSQSLMDRKDQKVSVDLSAGEALLRIDKDKITRVIDNLIGNAIKFTPPGGEININTQIVSNGLQITVKDNGIGIPQNIKHQVFSGSSGGRIGTSGEKSHGLGLSICKKIVEDYGGTINFLSRTGKGSIFYVWLPNVTLKNVISA